MPKLPASTSRSMIFSFLAILFAFMMSDGLSAEETASEQTLCPVMEGRTIDKRFFADYKGTRVYFCCEFCIETFRNDPEKYMARLPACFTSSSAKASSPAVASGKEKRRGSRPFWRQLGPPFGSVAIVFLMLTFLSGLFGRHLGRRRLLIHKLCAFTAVGAGILHAILIHA